MECGCNLHLSTKCQWFSNASLSNAHSTLDAHSIYLPILQNGKRILESLLPQVTQFISTVCKLFFTFRLKLMTAMFFTDGSRYPIPTGSLPHCDPIIRRNI